MNDITKIKVTELVKDALGTDDIDIIELFKNILSGKDQNPESFAIAKLQINKIKRKIGIPIEK